MNGLGPSAEARAPKCLKKASKLVKKPRGGYGAPGL